ncbi:hypothetical protein [Roseobacter sp. TSBP12]|uniref:hypothetical protein n=1 Tax=Roseobacter sp. TSBP12 TaxID=1236613 RepID=UPI00125ECC01|nr:hypothetical protein [Roseobacter sp. TSBP12]KAB6714324.1 hypothetical protein C8029_21535 [Roseobacter sp. TSBP12]
MRKSDIRSLTTIAVAISATLSGTTASVGNIVDVSNFQHVTLAYFTGTVTDAGTAAGFSVEIQESDTTADADFTAVADTDLIGTEAALAVTDDASDTIPVGSVGYIGTKKYVRAVITGTTGTDAAVSGAWILQGPRYAPVVSATAANISAT